MLLRFMGKKFEDGVEQLRQTLLDQGLDPDDKEIWDAFLIDPTFADGTYNLPVEARWSTIINTPAPKLNVALDTVLKVLGDSGKQLKGCFVEGEPLRQETGSALCGCTAISRFRNIF